jgi:hypothetical protein
MRCQRCHADVPLGAGSPRQFLTVAGACMVTALVAATVGVGLSEGFGRDISCGLAAAGALASLFALAATRTNMIDGCSMGPGGRTLGGAECPACGQVNPIRPWSR